MAFPKGTVCFHGNKWACLHFLIQDIQTVFVYVSEKQSTCGYLFRREFVSTRDLVSQSACWSSPLLSWGFISCNGSQFKPGPPQFEGPQQLAEINIMSFSELSGALSPFELRCGAVEHSFRGFTRGKVDQEVLPCINPVEMEDEEGLDCDVINRRLSRTLGILAEVPQDKMDSTVAFWRWKSFAVELGMTPNNVLPLK